jgi:hypothetical protein
MPRKKIQWFCKKCGAEFKSRVEAVKCETTHYKIRKIVGKIYHQNRAPKYIQVEVDIGDGCYKDITYQITEEGWGGR